MTRSTPRLASGTTVSLGHRLLRSARGALALAPLAAWVVPAALLPALAPAPVAAQVQDPNTHYVRLQGSTMTITNVLWYVAHAGSQAQHTGLSAFYGQYNCTIDGRGAQMIISARRTMFNASEGCVHGGACNYNSARSDEFVEFREQRAPAGAWVRMQIVDLPRIANTTGSAMLIRHPNSPQNWELRVTGVDWVVQPSDPRYQRIGPFLNPFVTTMSGHTVWEGRRFPLSCSRVDMPSLRQTVLQRWAP